MRFLILLTLTACSALGAAEMWRWVDSEGVVHYADRAVPGAEKFTLQSTQRPSTSTSTPTRPIRQSAQPAEFRYTGCAIGSPSQDQVFSSVNTVNASIELLPGQRTGDRVVMYLNGRRVENWPEAALGSTLTGLYRGTYSLSAQIVDPMGGTMCTSPSVTFHVRQPSIQSPRAGVPTVPRAPLAPGAPKPPGRP